MKRFYIILIAVGVLLLSVGIAYSQSPDDRPPGEQGARPPGGRPGGGGNNRPPDGQPGGGNNRPNNGNGESDSISGSETADSSTPDTGTTSASSSTGVTGTSDGELSLLLAVTDVEPLTINSTATPEMLALGEALFWDPILSGNKDVACATCHHPLFGTGDSLSLPSGTGGIGVGSLRHRGSGREFVARNAPDLFNRGSEEWVTLLWDARLSGTPATGFSLSVGDILPPGLDSILAVQALFPVIASDEMRGNPGDVDITGQPNELALIEIADASDIPAIWDALMVRLLDIPEYQLLLQAAYPGVAQSDLGFQHATRAIAAYETVTFTSLDSPWDRYLAGDTGALSEDAKQGALLFYGDAGCSRCHSGPLLTDQQTHNVAVPHLGPGKTDDGLDRGRFNETSIEADNFAFRTPPLRNVAITGPWMHNGSYTDLEAVVRHMLDPVAGLATYDVSQLDTAVQSESRADSVFNTLVLATLDPLVQTPVILTNEEFNNLIAFLHSLTSPSALNLTHIVPDSVPSGLTVGGGG